MFLVVIFYCISILTILALPCFIALLWKMAKEERTRRVKSTNRGEGKNGILEAGKKVERNTVDRNELTMHDLTDCLSFYGVKKELKEQKAD